MMKKSIILLTFIAFAQFSQAMGKDEELPITNSIGTSGSSMPGPGTPKRENGVVLNDDWDYPSLGHSFPVGNALNNPKDSEQRKNEQIDTATQKTIEAVAKKKEEVGRAIEVVAKKKEEV